jgi:hypothetical protein
MDHHLPINGNRVSFPGNKAAGAWNCPLTSIKCRNWEIVALYLKCHLIISWHSAQSSTRTNFIHSAIRRLRGHLLHQLAMKKDTHANSLGCFGKVICHDRVWKHLMPNICCFLRDPTVLLDRKVSRMWSPTMSFTWRTWRFRLPEY